MDTIIKNCPCCGGPAQLQRGRSMNVILCHKCGLTTQYYSDSDKAVEAWNARGSGLLFTRISFYLSTSGVVVGIYMLGVFVGAGLDAWMCFVCMGIVFGSMFWMSYLINKEMR